MTIMDTTLELPQAQERQELSPLKQEICRRIAEGETMQSLCAEAEMPSRVTVFNWRNLDSAFDLALTRAYQSAGTVYGDKVIAIADKLEKGGGDWAKDRAAMDGYKWAASKFYARVFGEAQPRTLHQTYVAGDVQVIADEPQRQAMIQARQQFLGDKAGDTQSTVAPSKKHER